METYARNGTRRWVLSLQIVKNNNSLLYNENDKMELKSKVNKAADLMEQILGKFISHI